MESRRKTFLEDKHVSLNCSLVQLFLSSSLLRPALQGPMPENICLAQGIDHKHQGSCSVVVSDLWLPCGEEDHFIIVSVSHLSISRKLQQISYSHHTHVEVFHCLLDTANLCRWKHGRVCSLRKVAVSSRSCRSCHFIAFMVKRNFTPVVLSSL